MSRQRILDSKWEKFFFATFITAIYTLWSIWQEGNVFLVDMRKMHFAGYLITRVIFAGLLFLFSLWAINCIVKRKIKLHIDIWVTVLVIIGVVALWKCYGWYPYASDECNIFNAVIRYDFGKYGTYMTGLFYGLCLMLIPKAWSIAVLKMLFSVCCMYYCIKRLNDIFKTKWFMLLYIYFFVPAVAAGISVKIHRLPIYIFVYITLMVKLYCDYIDKVRLDFRTAVGIGITAAVLTQWRVEGIYLLILAPILCILVYRLEKKNVVRFVILSLVMQILVAIPMKTMGAQNSVYRQLVPACAYTIDNMSYEGWEEEKITDELVVLQNYMDFSELSKYQAKWENMIYGDVASMYGENEYHIWIQDFDSEEQIKEFDEAVLSIIRKQPLLFIKTRIKSADWVSKYYLCNDGNILINLAFGVSSNVFLPIFLLVICLFACMYYRKWIPFWITAGGLCNAFLTFLLAPAAYFKYYIVPYTLGYGIAAIIIIKWITSLTNRLRKDHRVRH